MTTKTVFVKLPHNIPEARVLLERSPSVEDPVIMEEPRFQDLNEKQRRALAIFNARENVFLTGPGGVGKSHLIRCMVESARNQARNVAVCAMTGCASVQLKCGATTLHSWSGIRLAKDENWQIVQSVVKNKRSATNWKTVDVLIVDEVSMMSRKIFELIEEIARTLRIRSRPFGGLQVVFCGDFFQLPPVGNEADPTSVQMCMESPQWLKVFPYSQCIELDQLYRQTDPQFVDILSEVRVGTLSEESVSILRKHVNRAVNLEETNNVVPTKLFPIKQKVEYVNKTMFGQITSTVYSVKFSVATKCATYIESGKPIDPVCLKTCLSLTPDEIEREVKFLVANIPPEEDVQFKVGAVVMCLVNLAVENGICNGSTGIVVDVYMKDGISLPVVKFANGVRLAIEKYAWQSEQYPSIVVRQLPITLAWAMTIHKSQGSTIEMAEMDIGRSVFAYGQAYVALSRVKSLHGLYLTDFNPAAIRADPKVVEFYEKIRGNTKIVNANTTLESKSVEPNKSSGGVIEVEECPVCYEKIQSTNVCTTACGHKYCLKCMLETYKMDSKRQCPICRANL